MEPEFIDWEFNPPCSKEELDDLSTTLNLEFPPQFVTFMLRRNGGAGWIEDKFYRIEPIAGILDLTGIYANLNHYTEFIVFGGDGAGEMYCFDRRVKPTRIILLPTVGSIEDAILVGDDLDDVWKFDIQSIV